MRILVPVFLVVLLFSVNYLHSESADDQAPANDANKIPNAYRVITHLHTSFSHDSKFGSEPNLQLKNLKDKGYQAVLVSEHDHTMLRTAQSDFFTPPLQNGGFETGKPYPSQWRSINLPRESAEYLNVTDSSLYLEGERSFHLSLQGNEERFDILSWAYRETEEDRILDRSIAYNLWLEFSLYLPEPPAPSDSVAYVCSVFERRDDPRYRDVNNKLCFYFSKEPWEDSKLLDLSNSTRQVSVRLDPPTVGKWETYELNLTDYALKIFNGLEDIPMKYLFLKKITVNLASKSGVPVEMYVDDLQVFSSWTREQMYDWWRKDIESYSGEDFLVIAGLETSLKPHIGAYGLEAWHDFSVYDSVYERVKSIEGTGAVSALPHPRASNFTAVKEAEGWGTELLEIYNTVHDSDPSSQVLKAWDQFLKNGLLVFGVSGFDSHGLIGKKGERSPTVVSEPVYENIVIANSLSRDDILSSLREGRVYVVRSEHPIRMSISPGLDKLQSGTVVYTSDQGDALVSIRLDGISPSDLILIQNGSRVMTIDVNEHSYYKEIQMPLAGTGAYIRAEVHYLGEEVAFSNPLFFRKADLPKGFWVALDPVISSSNITSVETERERITVHIDSKATSSAVLMVHSPIAPVSVNVDGNGLAEYALSATDQLGDTTTDGWNYDAGNQISTVKILSGGPKAVTLEFPQEQLTVGELSNIFLFMVVAVGAGVAGIIIKFRHKIVKLNPRRNQHMHLGY